MTDYLGTPTHAYDKDGALVWSRELDIYGRCLKGDNGFVPFLYQGQYYDKETQLAYNRFRYYDPKIGMYISQDPIGIEGGIALYGYVHDINNWIDYLGLTGTPSAKAKAKEAAKNLRTQYRKGLITDLPTATTAVVNKRTGEVFIGNSGVKPMVTNTTLLQEMPKVSLEKWPVNNCGEVDALDKALKKKGAKLSDLEVFTVRTSTGKKMKPCKNCEITTKHTH